MVIDTSAILAILLEEQEAGLFVHKISQDRIRLCSAVNFVEASIVLRTRKGERGRQKLDQFLKRAQVDVASVDVRHAEIACQAYQEFGKGKHPAGLNLGDCFSYALAKSEEQPLLYKGNDFALTDVQSAAID
ncbi:type II toxin-antitoxin system VapC family toxin [Acidobacterium sp. S8]|uniref:type II toxin-antitoxin system VapC family toxin n=1 Tax=Acidobacterium sp. S8 TaxID=1641854 RepID=UPI00131B7184|nr:type II toxin-antitoxin system VapC family toxin [Acidobacterium sp. S8]